MSPPAPILSQQKRPSFPQLLLLLRLALFSALLSVVCAAGAAPAKIGEPCTVGPTALPMPCEPGLFCKAAGEPSAVVAAASSSSGDVSAAVATPVGKCAPGRRAQVRELSGSPDGDGSDCRFGGNIIPIDCPSGLQCRAEGPPPSNPDIATKGHCVP